MALNPLRGRLRQASLDAFQGDSPFRAEGHRALASFRQARQAIEQQVRSGRLTLTVAREQAAAALAELRAQLASQAAQFAAAPRAFLDRLAQVVASRQAEPPTLESLQRETNHLLRQVLIEQQVQNRVAEFASRTTTRALDGGPSGPTLATLLKFHAETQAAGDLAAQEWVRRELESLRPRVLDASQQRLIDQACDRPDQVNPRTVEQYLGYLETADPTERERFVSQAILGQDATACCAAFALARSESADPATPWVVALLEGVSRFPAAALATLHSWELDAREAEAAAAQAVVTQVSEVAEAEARLAHLRTPTDRERSTRERLEPRPVAGPDEPVGLTLARRGRFTGEITPAPVLEEPAASNE